MFQIRKSAREYHDFFSKHPNPKPVQQQTWQPLSGDTLKVNIDGSCYEQNSSGGWGFIIHDHITRGEAVGAGAGRLDHLQDPLQAEAEACLHAMNLMREWGMKKIEVETDAQLLVHAITGRDHDLAKNGVLFKEIKSFARLNFFSFSISYCPRACNKIADTLANLGPKMVLEPQAIWPGQ